MSYKYIFIQYIACKYNEWCAKVKKIKKLFECGVLPLHMAESLHPPLRFDWLREIKQSCQFLITTEDQNIPTVQR